jgi:hypothetical protein
MMYLYLPKKLSVLALASLFTLMCACTDGSFTGSGSARNLAKDNEKDPNKSDTPGNDPDDGKDDKSESDDIDEKDDKDADEEELGDEEDKTENEDDLSIDDEEKHLPQKCTATNGTVVSGVKECPANNAAFTSDDGSSARVGCCPLPSRDILDKASKATGRGGSCQTDEIAVGSDGSGFMCRKINTKKYRLEAAQQVCYRGNGASGGSGSSSCSNIIAQLQGLIGLENDKDGCVAQPYGAIMTHKTGKDCKDQKASVIVEKATGKAVQMFP